MRLRRRQERKPFGRVMVEIDTIDSPEGGIPIMYLLEGATKEDADYRELWFETVRLSADVRARENLLQMTKALRELGR